MPRSLPPLNALRAFEAAARLGSLEKAGAELGVTHGAISRQLRALEAWLEADLFDRGGRSLQLTAAGRDYLEAATGAFERLAEATERLRVRRRPSVLAVSTTSSFAARWLLPRLGAFRELHPEVEIWLSVEQGLTDFSAQSADVAIRMGAGPWSGLHAVPLMEERLFPACSPELLASMGAPETPDDLRRFPLLHDGDPATAWRLWLDHVGATHVDPDRGLRLAGSDILIQAAVAGQGVALVRGVLAADDLAAGRLIRPFPDDLSLGTAYWLVVPERNRGRVRVRAFEDWIVAACAGLS